MDIPAALALGKTAIEMAKGLAQLNRDQAVTQKAIELQSVIVDLQAKIGDAGLEIDALTRENRNLQELLAKKADLDRYRMVQFASGDVVYTADGDALKPGEIAHYICPSCAADGKRSLLQPSINGRGLLCRSCSVGYTIERAPKNLPAPSGTPGSWMGS